MRRWLVFSMTLFAIICSAKEAFGFDHRRKGFILGLGIGPGVSSFTERVESPWFSRTSERENRFSVMTDFKIGYAPSNLAQIYWMSKVSWFTFDDDLIANGLGGIGVTYYLKPEAPSLFFTGGLGLSSWGDVFGDSGGQLYGLGLVIGAGYEFSRHWSVEFDVAWGSPRNEQGGFQEAVDPLSLKLTFNVLAY